MTDIEELKQVLKTLNKFNLPISPILEYAIKEKVEQLSSKDESQVVMPVIDVHETNETIESPFSTSAGVKKKVSVLRVIRDNGTIIECQKAANTLCQAIKEVGVGKVFELKIPMDNMYLVTIGGNPQYPTAQHDVGNGYYVNVHSNTATKKRQLERIFKAYNLNWKADIVELN